MKIEYSADVIYQLLHTATLAARQRFETKLKEIHECGGYVSTIERIELLKEFGTVRIAIGRHAGHTSAAIKLADEFFESNGQRTMYFGPTPDVFSEMGAPETARWNDASGQDPRCISAIFIDPGPHAGSKARDAIYQYASEAMCFEDSLSPVLIFFIGS